jgi:N-acetylmuramoyl-L-alanine amidase
MAEIIDAPSPNHDERSAPPDMIVLHYTGMQNGAAALERLRDAEAKVSSHYLIEEDGRVFSLVDEDRRAWHAGVSHWGGHDTLNGASIGIEIVNPGHEWGYRAFPEVQMQAVERLVADIVRRRDIPLERVVGHSDIAPSRKEDPGELFDWRRLAVANLAIWPDAADETEPGRLLDPEGFAALARALATCGYSVDNLTVTLRAFRRRFRPTALDGLPVMRDFLIAREIAARWPAVLDGAGAA